MTNNGNSEFARRRQQQFDAEGQSMTVPSVESNQHYPGAEVDILVESITNMLAHVDSLATSHYGTEVCEGIQKFVDEKRSEETEESEILKKLLEFVTEHPAILRTLRGSHDQKILALIAGLTPPQLPPFKL